MVAVRAGALLRGGFHHELGVDLRDLEYRFAGCVDVRDDGDNCKPGKVVTLRYRTR